MQSMDIDIRVSDAYKTGRVFPVTSESKLKAYWNQRTSQTRGIQQEISTLQPRDDTSEEMDFKLMLILTFTALIVAAEGHSSNTEKPSRNWGVGRGAENGK